MNSKAKGNSFEISFCKELSRFLTEGNRDDLFWRTSNSGGRQTVRYKKGLDTENQAGDITNTHSDGGRFMDIFCVECKFYKNIGVWSIFTNTLDQNIVGWWKTHLQKSDEVDRMPLLIMKQNHKPILWGSDFQFKNLMIEHFKVRPLVKVYELGLYLYLQDVILGLDSKKFNEMLKNFKENQE